MRRVAFVLVPYLLAVVLTNCGQGADNRDESGRNRLRLASSPYLLEHADNPVDWYEWGPEALERAKKENKPLIISIGYAACHWCHVMERESFMDTAVARIMNENFIAIKVDREERPDIDQIYLQASQLVSGNSGWPLNAFALPDGRPFYAATYFPKQQWLTMLQQVRKAYDNEYDNVLKQAEALTDGVEVNDLITSPADSIAQYDRNTYHEAHRTAVAFFDANKGGLAGAPKFPMPVVWEWLLQHHYLTGDQTSLSLVTKTLDQMLAGGIYDQLEGGFARYSTDDMWKVPHFEKMLYDNGQLVSLYAHAFQVTGSPRYAEIVAQTLSFVEHNLLDDNGGFYSSLNADSEGEEGSFYVWSAGEIDATLAEEAGLIKKYYNVTEGGNWEEGKNILYRTQDDAAFARDNGLTPEVWRQRLRDANKILYDTRNRREKPSVDDKILVSWNALMLKGYVDAYKALGDAAYLKAAIKNARFLEQNMLSSAGQLSRNFKDGKASIPGFLDDYAIFADALISLYEATFDIHWLEQSKAITEYAVQHFRDDASGMFFYTSDETTGLVARKMELADNVIPSSNSVMASVLHKLGVYYALASWEQMSRTMVNQVAADIQHTGPYYAGWASLMGAQAFEGYEVAVMGSDALDKSRQLQRHYFPTALFMGGVTENLPLLEYKRVDGRTMIYVCRKRICKLPVESVELAVRQLSSK
jgi:uncharacterized protein YyaL (SSP411 family)